MRQERESLSQQFLKDAQRKPVCQVISPGHTRSFRGFEDGALEAMGTVWYCVESGWPPIRPYRVVEIAVERLAGILPPTDKEYRDNLFLVGTGLFGPTAGAIPLIWNDGQYGGWHNQFRNDADFTFLTSLSQDAFEGILENAAKLAEEEDRALFNNTPGWGRISHQWQKSIWDLPLYMKTMYNYWDNIHPAFDIHHQQINGSGNDIERLLCDYAPCYSSVIGLPIYLGLITAGGKIEEKIWRPFLPEKSSQHTVSLSTPGCFAEEERSILMIPRVALFTIQAGVSTGRPAIINTEHLAITREAVARHSPGLTVAKRQSAQRRYETCLYRAGLLESATRSPCLGRHRLFEKNGLPGAKEQIHNLLDEIGWIKAVLE